LVVSNEHKLARDLFHALSLVAFATAFFASGAEPEIRAAAAIVGVCAQLLAHGAIRYDYNYRLSEMLRERRERERVEQLIRRRWSHE
jgi:hypothetical protein